MGGADIINIIIDSTGLFKSEYINFINPIQIPIFPYLIHIGVNNVNNIFILLRHFNIIYIYN